MINEIRLVPFSTSWMKLNLRHTVPHFLQLKSRHPPSPEITTDIQKQNKKGFLDMDLFLVRIDIKQYS